MDGAVTGHDMWKQINIRDTCVEVFLYKEKERGEMWRQNISLSLLAHHPWLVSTASPLRTFNVGFASVTLW